MKEKYESRIQELEEQQDGGSSDASEQEKVSSLYSVGLRPRKTTRLCFIDKEDHERFLQERQSAVSQWRTIR